MFIDASQSTRNAFALFKHTRDNTRIRKQNFSDRRGFDET